MKTNIIYPIYEKTTVGGIIVTNLPINLDNVTHLSFQDDFQDRRGFSNIYFHLNETRKLEWVFGKSSEYNEQCDRLKELSIQ